MSEIIKKNIVAIQIPTQKDRLSKDGKTPLSKFEIKMFDDHGGEWTKTVNPDDDFKLINYIDSIPNIKGIRGCRKEVSFTLEGETYLGRSSKKGLPRKQCKNWRKLYNNNTTYHFSINASPKIKNITNKSDNNDLLNNLLEKVMNNAFEAYNQKDSKLLQSMLSVLSVKDFKAV